MKTPLVISVEDTGGRNYLWASRDIEYFLDESTWGKVHFNCELPRNPSSGDRLKIYVWNPKRYEFTIDEMEIRFYD
jgi:hypothetical protein